MPDDLDRIEEGLARRGAGDEAGHRDRIAADIEDAAAGEVVGEEPVLRHEACGIWKPKLAWIMRTSPIAPDWISSPSFAVCGWRRYMKASPTKVPAFARRGTPHRPRRPQRHRLFDQHVLAGLGGLDRPLGVAGMRRRDIDGVDLGIARRARSRRRCGRPGTLRRGRALWIARGDRDQLAGWDAATPRQRPWRSCRGR